MFIRKKYFSHKPITQQRGVFGIKKRENKAIEVIKEEVPAEIIEAPVLDDIKPKKSGKKTNKENNENKNDINYEF